MRSVTLNDFLLARIAEDAAVDSWGYPSGWWLHKAHCMTHAAVDRNDATCDCDGPARWKAECEAKRTLITGESAITFAARAGRGPSELHRFVMQTLAMPYANHPDYRDEWRL